MCDSACFVSLSCSRSPFHPLHCTKAQKASPLPPYRYFPQSGHTLAEPFRSFWEAAPDPVRTYGYPISEPFIERSFTEPDAYYRVQYFERAILEEQPAPIAAGNTRPIVVGRLLGTRSYKAVS